MRNRHKRRRTLWKTVRTAINIYEKFLSFSLAEILNWQPMCRRLLLIVSYPFLRSSSYGCGCASAGCMCMCVRARMAVCARMRDCVLQHQSQSKQPMFFSAVVLIQIHQWDLTWIFPDNLPLFEANHVADFTTPNSNQMSRELWYRPRKLIIYIFLMVLTVSQLDDKHALWIIVGLLNNALAHFLIILFKMWRQ